MSSPCCLSRRQRNRTQLAALVLAVLSSVALSYAGQTLTPFVVTYISMENVYLGGGRGAGLAVGDTLSAKSGDSLVASLVVLAVSTHSASCRSLRTPGSVRTGDSVFAALKSIETTVASRPLRADLPSRPEPVFRPAPPTAGGRASFHPTGSISLVHNQWWDHVSAARNYAQSTADMHLQIPRLWGTGLTAVFRANLRRDYGNAGMRAGSSRRLWTDRIYEMSLVYNAPDAGVSFYGGRMMIPRLATIGYLDGLAVEHRLSGSLRAGLFAGLDPRWHYLDSRPPLQKYGGYLAVTTGSFQSAHFDLVIAAAGEFHSSIVSREALHIAGHMGGGNRWDISHAIELDLNSGWRRQNARSTVSLSSLYLDGRYRLANWLTAGASYDNRKPYWTYETRSIVDSLFDTHVRQGIRTRLDLTLPAGISCRGSVGFRNQQGEPDQSTSYTGSIDKRGFLTNRGTIGVQWSSFSGTTLNGRDMSLRISQGFGWSSTIDLGVGQYSYRTSSIGSVKINRWIECNAHTSIATGTFLSANYRYSTGEDIIGSRLQAGCTHSF